MNSPRRPLQERHLFIALNVIKQHVLSLDSQTTGKAPGRVEDVPKRVVAEVPASTSQVTSGSVLPREKVELAIKLLEVSSRML